jgi:hypothetical protein
LLGDLNEGHPRLTTVAEDANFSCCGTLPAPSAARSILEDERPEADDDKKADQEDDPNGAADELQHWLTSYVAAQGILDLADAFLNLAFDLISLSAAFGFLVPSCLANRFLGRPDDVLCWPLMRSLSIACPLLLKPERDVPAIVTTARAAGRFAV